MKIFVYGTLREGYANHNRHLSHSEKVGEGTINANRLDELTVVPTDGDETTRGEVYEVDDKTLRGIDRLEGYDRTRGGEQGGYVRTPVEVTLDSGETVEAEAYLVNTLGHPSPSA